jgi:hypothetical protein
MRLSERFMGGGMVIVHSNRLAQSRERGAYGAWKAD